MLFFGVAWKANESECRAYVEEFDVPYENALDADEAIFRAFKVGYQPATAFITLDGNLAHIEYGPVDERTLAEHISELTAAPS
ncbi:MAG: hypothetical protein WD826_05720 [Actinomycetota bacterium]